jgi:hypothetical protein
MGAVLAELQARRPILGHGETTTTTTTAPTPAPIAAHDAAPALPEIGASLEDVTIEDIARIYGDELSRFAMVVGPGVRFTVHGAEWVIGERTKDGSTWRVKSLTRVA